MIELSPEKARIFRITHISNVEWILENGLHCRNSPVKDPNFVQIGNADLIAKRASRAMPEPHEGTLDDYVPFYFTPHSPMLYNIATGWGGIQRRPMKEIVILVSSLNTLTEHHVDFVFSDRHAYLELAKFSTSIAELSKALDWKMLKERDFKRDPQDPGRFERYQAEALAVFCVPIEAMTGIVCHGAAEEQHLRSLIEASGAQLELAARPGWFF
jgi:hypothetical protein